MEKILTYKKIVLGLLAFWVPLCILPVYDLEPSFLGFFVFNAL